MNESLVISYTGIDGATSNDASYPFLVLRQEQAPKTDNNPTGNDLITMYNYIVAGLSAHQYTDGNCPVRLSDVGIELTLGVFVHLNPIDLEYAITSNKGDLIGPQLIIGEEERQIVIGMTDEYDFEYLLTDVDFSWETLAYNTEGDVIQRPDYEIVGTKVVFTEPVFMAGWARVGYTVHKYDAKITVYYDENFSYTDRYGNVLNQEEAIRAGVVSYILADFSTTVTASYMIGTKEYKETLNLDIPDCVNSFINVCLEEESGTGDRNTDNPKDDDRITIYYDDCDGSTLGVED